MQGKMVRAKKVGRGTKRKAVHLTIRRVNGKWDVSPPYPRISKGERPEGSLAWHAADTDAEIYFPTGLPFGWYTKFVQKGTTVYSGSIVPKCPEKWYTYTVFCHKGGRADCFVDVGSDPSVKVDP